eukprot:305940-Chlamydomonas_euryale.AAC.2
MLHPHLCVNPPPNTPQAATPARAVSTPARQPPSQHTPSVHTCACCVAAAENVSRCTSGAEKNPPGVSEGTDTASCVPPRLPALQLASDRSSGAPASSSSDGEAADSGKSCEGPVRPTSTSVRVSAPCCEKRRW